MNYSLNVKDRVVMQGILPKEGDFITMTVVEDVTKKTKLTQTEFEETGLKSSDNGQVIWERDKVIEVEFSDAELNIIKEALKKLDSDKKLDINTIDLYRKFIS